MIGSSQNLKVRDILCALRFVREVNVSISHGGRDGSGVAEWARALTGDRTVNGLSPAAEKLFASELWQFRLPRLASVFRMRH